MESIKDIWEISPRYFPLKLAEKYRELWLISGQLEDAEYWFTKTIPLKNQTI